MPTFGMSPYYSLALLAVILVQIRVLAGLCSFRTRVFGQDDRILSGWTVDPQIAVYRPTRWLISV